MFASYKGSKNFEIGSRDPGHAYLGVILRFIRRNDPSSISVPNLKRIAQFVQKLLKVSKNLEIKSCDPAHVHLRVILWSVRSRGQSSMSVPNLKQIYLYSFQSY